MSKTSTRSYKQGGKQASKQASRLLILFMTTLWLHSLLYRLLLLLPLLSSLSLRFVFGLFAKLVIKSSNRNSSTAHTHTHTHTDTHITANIFKLQNYTKETAEEEEEEEEDDDAALFYSVQTAARLPYSCQLIVAIDGVRFSLSLSLSLSLFLSLFCWAHFTSSVLPSLLISADHGSFCLLISCTQIDLPRQTKRQTKSEAGRQAGKTHFQTPKYLIGTFRPHCVNSLTFLFSLTSRL